MRTIRVTVKIPPEIRKWLEERATYFGGTLSGEVTRCCRAFMEEEAAKRPSRAEAAE